MRPHLLTALGLGLGLLSFTACDRNSADTTVETTTAPGGDGTTTTPLTKPVLKAFSPAKDTTRAFEDSTIAIRMVSDAVSPNLFYVNGSLVLNAETSTSAAVSTFALALGTNKLTLKVVRAGDSTKSYDTSVTVTRKLPTPAFSVKDSISYAPVTVALSVPAGLGTIRFTTDGRDPLSTDSAYAAPLTFTGTTTLKARLFTASGSGGDVATMRYQIYHQVQKPTFSTRAIDTFSVVTKVALKPASSTDTIRYTTDGGDPTNTSPVYRDSLLLTQSTKVKARSFNGLNKSSAVESTTVVLAAIKPVLSLKGGTYKVSSSLTMSSASSVPVYYSVDSTLPLEKWTRYATALTIDSNMTVWAYAGSPGWTPSATVSASYRFMTSTPTFLLKPGTYDTTKLLPLADSTAGATIHYTLDGTAPSCTSPQYASALTLDSTTLVKVVGCREGWTSSSVDSGLYVFKVAPIVFTPDSGVYDGKPTISLKTRSPGVTFYYTIDSSAPTATASGTTRTYSAPFVLGSTNWVRVLAVRKGWTSSDIADRYYVVQGDTLLLSDFENGKVNVMLGGSGVFTPEGCKYGNTTSGSAGCTNTKNNSDLLTRTPAGSPAELGNFLLRMQFDLHPASNQDGSDASNGPGFASIYAPVPTSFMGRANTVAFWARFKPEGNNTATSAPLMVEMAHSGLDNGNSQFTDGFERMIVKIDTNWKFYQLDFQNFWYPHYAIVQIADSTNTTPKQASWIRIDSVGGLDLGTANAMTSLGLNKWWGIAHHSYSSILKWLHNVNRDAGYNKGTISKFRWTILQPSSTPEAMGSDQGTAGLSSSFQGSLYLDRVQVYRSKQ